MLGRRWYRHCLEDLRKLLQAGIPVLEALETELESARGAAAEFVRRILDHVRRGAGLGEAFAACPEVPEEHAALVEAGERSGTLVVVLEKLVARIDRRQELLSQLRAKVTYPVALLCFAVTLLPSYLLFAEQASLYVLVQVAFWGGAAVIGLLVWQGPRALEGRPAIREAVERWVTRVPFLGRVLVDGAAGRSLGLLGLLIGSGLPLGASLKLVSKTARLLGLRASLGSVEPKLLSGSTLTQALASTAFFAAHRDWLARVAAGEKAGALDQVLTELGESLEISAQGRLAVILKILPVGVMVLVGAFVLWRALGVAALLQGRF